MNTLIEQLITAANTPAVASYINLQVFVAFLAAMVAFRILVPIIDVLNPIPYVLRGLHLSAREGTHLIGQHLGKSRLITKRRLS